MVIRTEITSQRYAVGSSDPFPARFEIQFGSLNFQATGNGYLMCLTNRDELHLWGSTGPGPMPATPATDNPTPTKVAATNTSTAQVLWPTLAPGVRGAVPVRTRHGAGGCAHRRNNAPAGEHVTIWSQFPYGMRNAAMMYTSSVSTDMAAYKDLPGHHLLAVWNLIATTNDESYHGSTSELPPMTSHGYTEWDFSGVPDLVMFQRFLDAADY
jgi:hypothetical protein